MPCSHAMDPIDAQKPTPLYLHRKPWDARGGRSPKAGLSRLPSLARYTLAKGREREDVRRASRP